MYFYLLNLVDISSVCLFLYKNNESLGSYKVDILAIVRVLSCYKQG